MNPPAGGAGGGGPRKLAVNKSLKPFTLLATHNPTEFKCWGRQFRGYYRSSNMDLLEVSDQQLYFQSCVEPILWRRIQGKIDETTQIFEDEGCMTLLFNDFNERWPLFNRRMAFFTSEQAQGQDLSAWISQLEELADEAEIEDIKMEDVLLFRILTGTTNMKFRGELTKLPAPTLKDYKRKVTDLEIARRMESSIDKSKGKAMAGQVKSQGRGRQGGQGGNKKGGFHRCGDEKHFKAECRYPPDVKCHACGKPGHIATICRSKLTNKGGADSSKSNKEEVGPGQDKTNPDQLQWTAQFSELGH